MLIPAATQNHKQKIFPSIAEGILLFMRFLTDTRKMAGKSIISQEDAAGLSLRTVTSLNDE